MSNAHWEHREQHNPSQGIYPTGPDREDQARTRATITQAYSQTPDAELQRNASKARAWKFDARHEQMAMLQDTQPEVYSKMPVTNKVALGLYLEGKRCAAEAGLDTGAPT